VAEVNSFCLRSTVNCLWIDNDEHFFMGIQIQVVEFVEFVLGR